MQSDYAWPTLFLGVVALISIAADWRRQRRREADRARGRTGWVPWPLITVLSLILGAVCAASWLGDR